MQWTILELLHKRRARQNLSKNAELCSMPLGSYLFFLSLGVYACFPLRQLLEDDD